MAGFTMNSLMYYCIFPGVSLSLYFYAIYVLFRGLLPEKQTPITVGISYIFTCVGYACMFIVFLELVQPYKPSYILLFLAIIHFTIFFAVFAVQKKSYRLIPCSSGCSHFLPCIAFFCFVLFFNFSWLSYKDPISILDFINSPVSHLKTELNIVVFVFVFFFSIYQYLLGYYTYQVLTAEKFEIWVHGNMIGHLEILNDEWVEVLNCVIEELDMIMFI